MNLLLNKPNATITLYSHGYCINNMSQKVKEVVERFAERFIDKTQMSVKQQGRYVIKELIGGSYYGVTFSQTEYRFHINTINDFKAHLQQNKIALESFESHKLKPNTGRSTAFEWHSDKSDRAHQPPAIKHITEPRRTSVLALQTGKGKTYCAMRAIKEIGVRTLLILRPGYVDRWIPDLKSHFGFAEDEILWISSGSQILQIVDNIQEGYPFNPKLIVINNTAISRYLDDYEKSDGEEDYGCRPENLMEVLGVGLRIIDEVHEFFELNMRMDCYFNIARAIYLSATLKPSNRFLRHMYEIMMPESTRYEMEFDQYVAAKAVFYRIGSMNGIKTNGYMGMYSHVAFEKSLIKNRLMHNYCRFITRLVDDYFIGIRKPGQKALVFAAQVETCKEIFKELRQRWPALSISLYVSGSSYAESIKADIIVSTLKSAGTAVDIPGLRTTFMSTSINSDQANEQVLGRTRNLPDGETPEFIYLVCWDIPKQVFYHNEKKRIFGGKVIGHYEHDSGYVLTSKNEAKSWR